MASSASAFVVRICAFVTVMLSLALGFGPSRAEGPAVSDVNLKLSGFGGSIATDGLRDGLGGAAVSLTLPVMLRYGLQIDGAYARVGDGNFGNAGAHFFWRDPGLGLIGVYAGYARIDRLGGLDLGRTGLEGQYYLPRITLDTAAGYKFGDVDGQAYGRARLQYYPIDNLMLQGGWVHETRSYANAGVELQIASSAGAAVSVFADTRVRDDRDYVALGGLKLTLGADMSLKDRHRRQDPEGYSSYDLQQLQQSAAQGRPAQSQPGKTSACPFTPASAICDRANQCTNAGYSFASPGPDACGCVAAFDAPC